MELWIVLIVLGVVVLAGLVYGVVRHVKKNKKEQEEGENGMKEKILVS